jgi:glutamyl/glutaminyl-tRNA synthetase
MRKLSPEQWIQKIEKSLSPESLFHEQNQDWKRKFYELYQEKIQVAPEAQGKVDEIFQEQVNLQDEDLKEALSWESTPALFQHISDELAEVKEDENLSVESVEKWMGHLKKELKIKGKPLFMGTRAVLTGQTHGPDLKLLVSLTPVSVLKNRLSQVAQALVK